MKKILLMGAICLSVFSFSQKTKHREVKKLQDPIVVNDNKIDADFQKYMKISDSLNYKSDAIIHRLIIIDNIDYYRDKLILSENYKDPIIATEIFDSYNRLTGNNYDVRKIVKSQKNIDDFFRIQKSLNKVEIIAEMIEYDFERKMEDISQKIDKEKKIIDENEKIIIKALREANYPIEKYNKLSVAEKDKLLEDISNGYKYEK